METIVEVEVAALCHAMTTLSVTLFPLAYVALLREQWPRVLQGRKHCFILRSFCILVLLVKQNYESLVYCSRLFALLLAKTATSV
jgi:hypothetical protein